MPRDIFIRLNRCHYCNRPGFVVWDVDLFSCDREVCKSLAFAEVRRRHRDLRRSAPPEIRELSGRYPAPAAAPEPVVPPPDPRHRRFVRSGRTVSLRRERQRERAAA